MPLFQRHRVVLLSLALLTLAWVAYFPGLSGSFLFDDFANLPALGATGPVDNLTSFWRYITSGTADPTGRPLALLSFLLDARDWPSDPFPFKRTNLLLHLLIGGLLAQLLRRLGRELVRPQSEATTWRIDAAAVLGAAFWLLHPLFVSTTLYIVQREAMLPALFTVAGLLAWLRGRRAFQRGEAARGLAWIMLGLGGGTLLGTLSKANGILLPALALTIELTLLNPQRQTNTGSGASRSYRHAMWVLAGVPTLCVIGYLSYEGWRGLAYGISSVRSWTLAQRLLTEPRVLLDYLGLLWLPRPFTPGLFNDHILASTSFWSPWTTVPALLAVLTLIVGALVVRKRLPAVALAILFFFVGQSLESSTVALELYFEHRNYLPALLMFWPLALWLCQVPQRHPGLVVPVSGDGRSSRTPALLRASLAMLLLAGLGGMTYARAELWGNTLDQALLWARLNPASPRAQANAAQAEVSTGHPERAAARLQPALTRAPGEVQLALNLLGARCQMGRVDHATFTAAARALETTRDTGTLLAHWFSRAIGQSSHPQCPEMNLAGVGRLLDAAIANPHLTATAGRRQDLFHLQGRIALARKQPHQALAAFNRALDQQIRATAAFEQAALLGSAGYPTQGLAHLDHYQAESGKERRAEFGMPRVHAWVLTRQQYWARELARLRNTLVADQRAGKVPPS